MEILEQVLVLLLYVLSYYWKWVVGILFFVALFWIESHVRARQVKRMGLLVSSGGDLMYPYVSEAVLVFFVLAWSVEAVGTRWAVAGLAVYLVSWINGFVKRLSRLEEKLDDVGTRVERLETVPEREGARTRDSSADDL